MYKKGECIDISIDDCRGSRVGPSRVLRKAASLPQLAKVPASAPPVSPTVAVVGQPPLVSPSSLRPAMMSAKPNLTGGNPKQKPAVGGVPVGLRPDSRRDARGSVSGGAGGGPPGGDAPSGRQASCSIAIEPVPVLPRASPGPGIVRSGGLSELKPTDLLNERLDAIAIAGSGGMSPRPADAALTPAMVSVDLPPATPPLANASGNVTPINGSFPLLPDAALQQQQQWQQQWQYQPPPDNQRSFFFPEDGLAITSEFDSGNLIQVERVAPLRYNMYSCPDCGNSPVQTNSKQWFHFAVRGVHKGTNLHFTFIGQMPSKMYSFGWTPVACILPSKQGYSRISSRVNVTKLDAMPPTPGYPELVYKAYGNDDDEGGPATSIPLGTPLGTEASEDFAAGAKKADTNAVNVSFEYKCEVDVPLVSPAAFGPLNALALYFASNHPYSFTRLQRSIALWSQQAEGYYFHKETLCLSLDRLPVDMLTISDLSGMSADLEPSYDPAEPIPVSCGGVAGQPPQPRAHIFPRKAYVVLTARVHPGEAPASHILQGSVDFLLSKTDPRAIELRKHFVFVIVPMLNPDGVVRGHSRADTCGQNLNRMYKNPSRQQHPAPYCLRTLLLSLQRTGRLALYIDMHAHANKRGAFFYGNGMKAEDQIQNVLYAKLVSLNTPHFDFTSSNFSEQNMFAVGKSGEGKDTSSRVTIYQETGFVHSYTIETSYVTGTIQNAVAALPMIPGEEIDVIAGMPSPKYNQTTFADLGKGLLVALLDLKAMNPCSRLPSTSLRSTKGAQLWLQRAVLMELADFQRRQTALKNGLSISTIVAENSLVGLSAEDAPATFTLRSNKMLPAITIHNIAALIDKEKEREIIGSAVAQQQHQQQQQPSSAAGRSGSFAAKAGAVLPATRSSLKGPSAARRL